MSKKMVEKMRKRMPKDVILMLLALGVFLGFVSPYFSQPYSYGAYPSSSDRLELEDHAGGRGPDALDKVGEVLGAQLLGFSLEHGLEEKVKVTEIAFRLSDIEGISEEDITNIELAVDENANSVVEEKEARVGGLGWIDVSDRDGDMYVSFFQSFAVPAGKTNYILRADLANLVLGDKVTVTALSDRIEAETVLGADIQVAGYLSGVIHLAGNFAPVLSTPRTGPAEHMGVYPEMGKSGDEISFVIEYTDPDNDPPVLAQVWIDENDDGTYEENEKYDLNESLPADDLYNDGKLYQKTLNVFSAGDNAISFKFRFSDGELENEDKITDHTTIMIFPAASAEVWVENPEFVSGQKVILNTAFISYINVKEIDDASVKDLAKIDFSPFRFEKVILGRKEPLDEMQDFRVVTFLLSLSDDSAPGKYTIPSFEIPYSFTISVGIQEKVMQESTATRPIEIEKLPLLATSKVDRKAMVIGDRVHLTVSILAEKGLRVYLGNLPEGTSVEEIRHPDLELTRKVAPEVIQEELVEKLTFAPFRLLDAHFKKEDFGPVDSLVCDLTLGFYGLVDTLEGVEASGQGLGDPAQTIPSLRVLYYSVPGTVEAEEKIETRSVITESMVIKINSVLGEVSRYEDIKGALPSRSQYFFWFPLVGGSLTLIILGVIGIGQLTKSLALRGREVLEPWEIAKQRVERLTSDYSLAEDGQKNRAYLEALRRDSGAYLGLLIGLDGGQAQAKTSSELGRCLEDSNKMQSTVVDTIREILTKMDQLIFGDQAPRGEEIEAIVEGMKRVLEKTEGVV